MSGGCRKGVYGYNRSKDRIVGKSLVNLENWILGIGGIVLKEEKED